MASQWVNLSGPLTAAPPQFVYPNPLTLASAGGRSRFVNTRHRGSSLFQINRLQRSQ